jgi:hypothetical protein
MSVTKGTLEQALRPSTVGFLQTPKVGKMMCFDTSTLSVKFSLDQISDFLISLPRQFVTTRIVKNKETAPQAQFNVRDDNDRFIFSIKNDSQMMFTIEVLGFHPNIRTTTDPKSKVITFTINEAAFYDDIGIDRTFILVKMPIPRTHP